MRARIFFAIVSCATAWGVTACTAIIPLDSLTSGGTDASLEAANDSSVPDAAIDVGSDATEASSPFCLGKDATFCEDFDDSDATVFPKWTTLSQLRGGTVVRTTSTISLPHCVSCTIPSWDGGSSPVAQVQRTFLQTPTTSLRYAFALRVDKYPSTGGFNCATVKLSPVSDVHLSLSLSGSDIEETVPTDAGNTYPSHSLTQNFQPGKWSRVVMDFVFGSPIKLEVRVDGMLVLQTNLDPRQQRSGLVIGAGITYEGPVANGSGISIDDVLIDFQ